MKKFIYREYLKRHQGWVGEMIEENPDAPIEEMAYEIASMELSVDGEFHKQIKKALKCMGVSDIHGRLTDDIYSYGLRDENQD